MPHKRAKRSTREELKTQSGFDLAPQAKSLASESIPKSVARVLNAASVRSEWNKNKRNGPHEERADPQGGRAKRRRTEDGKAKAGLKIQAGESLAHFNRRVEDDMRPLVRTAMATSSAAVRKAKADAVSARPPKDATQPEEPSPPPTPPRRHADVPKEFARTSSAAPRRLNDIAQAPPELPKLRRAVANEKEKGGAGGRDGVLSMAQREMMEAEREKAIKRYRELKEAKLRAKESGLGQG